MTIHNRKVKIEYECNLCRKTRVIYVDPTLHSEVDSKGYIEYVDLHNCADSKLNAIILYVDKSLTVRSQVPVKLGTDARTEQITSFNIPTPQKVDLSTKKISKLKSFKGKNLKALEISDRLRQSKFVLDGGQGIEVESNSELGYIDIKAQINKQIELERAKEWLSKLASILEAIILLDEEMLSYLTLYLDPNLEKNPSTDEILELDLILHAKSAYPYSTLKFYSVFRRQWNNIIDTLTFKSFSNYEKVITHCIGNQHKTLLDVYQQKLAKNIPFEDFITIINELSQLGFLNIEKIEFITITD
ncbi:MAG: hypothetical protein ACTSRR_06690 [Candidatus Heimdallarchaeaceae archaeon]